MQDDQQLPRAAPALTYCICFSSLSAVTGPCLSVRDLGFRGSDMCQMSFWCLCGADFLSWHFVVVVFSQCFVAHKPHFPFDWLCIQQHSMHDALSSASCIRPSSHLSEHSVVAVLVQAEHEISDFHYTIIRGKIIHHNVIITISVKLSLTLRLHQYLRTD